MITDEMVKAMAMSLAVGRGRIASGPSEIKEAERALTAALPMIRAEVLEEAAKVAQDFNGAKHLAHDLAAGLFPKQSYMGEAIAAAIRAMKGGEA